MIEIEKIFNFIKSSILSFERKFENTFQYTYNVQVKSSFVYWVAYPIINTNSNLNMLKADKLLNNIHIVFPSMIINDNN